MAEGSGHRAARVWAGSELRRRWRSTVLLGLLAGITAGIALAATAGARRTDTAWDRLRAVTLASDAVAFPSNVGIDDADWSKVANLPQVAALGAFGFPYSVDGPCLPLIVSNQGSWLTDVDRPRVLKGRLPDPANPDEVTVATAFGAVPPAGCAAFHVGDTVETHLMTKEQIAAGRFDTAEGPTVQLHVVGETVSPFDLAVVPDTAGNLFVPPAFWEKYGADGQLSFSNALVRLKGGQADVPAFQQAVNDALGQPVPVRDLVDAGKRVTNGTGLERDGLYLFAVACALAGVVVVGQALGRAIRSTSDEISTLQALGLTRRERTFGLGLAYAPAVIVALVVAVPLAIALSSRFPIGLGAKVEPDPGIHADWTVLALGGAVLVAILLLQTAFASWRAARPRPEGVPGATSPIARFLSSMGAPISAVMGSRLALEPGRGKRALPTRPALAAALTGLLGVAAATALATGINDAVEHSSRFGATWDLEVSYQGDSDPGHDFQAMIDGLQANDDVTAVATINLQIVDVGVTTVPAFAITPTKGSLAFTVYRGRAPVADDETALGPSTMSVLHARIGDQVSVAGHDKRIVGEALLPQTPHSSYDQGVWLTSAAEAEMPQSGFPGFPVLKVRPGADKAALVSSLNAQGGEGTDVTLPSPPADQRNMDNVRTLPVLFAIFVTFLALAGIAHVGASVLRRRSGELATLRALGWTPRQAFACLLWQATVVVLVGAAIGVPLGLAIGRLLWRNVAESTPMIYVAPGITVLLVASIPAALVLANVIGAVSGRRAARLRPAEVLRAE
jgi:ABC-type lipoprotein release transport system permease subunit